MPVTVVIGGQYGSEGKGKVAHHFARERKAQYAVRIGGSNSGHTVVDALDEHNVFRQLPTAAILPDTVCVIGPGSYVDVDILLSEVDRLRLEPERLIIDPNAVIITERNKETERKSGLIEQIGSTGSGTGSAVVDRVQRQGDAVFAHEIPILRHYCGQSSSSVLRSAIDNGEWVVIEGTQGFGLSLLHSNHYPHVTSRDTSAAGFVAEAGISPLDVNEIVMVIRSYPIRVAGDSGPLRNETEWWKIQKAAGFEYDITERTTVTNKVRRVGEFDAEVVRHAILVNRPTHIVLNHIDYIDFKCRSENRITSIADRFLSYIENQIDRGINLVGTSPKSLLDRSRTSDPFIHSEQYRVGGK